MTSTTISGFAILLEANVSTSPPLYDFILLYLDPKLETLTLGLVKSETLFVSLSATCN